jgi:hypothetical protein
VLDYPTSAENRPRYGYDRPTHPELGELVRRNDDAYEDVLETILAHRDALSRIPSASEDEREPAWRNSYLPALDGAALYTFLCERRPAHYVEIGSGNSTRFVARAKRDRGLATEIVSIDPHPRAEMEALCDTAIRSPLETVDLTVFDKRTMWRSARVCARFSSRCGTSPPSPAQITTAAPSGSKPARPDGYVASSPAPQPGRT